MKLLFLCNRDLASCLALNRLLPALSDQHDIKLALSARVGGNKSLPVALRALKFVEQDFFNDVVFPMAQARTDRPASALKTFEELARLIGQPLRQWNRLNDAKELEQMRAMAPDLVISIRYGVILKAAALAIPRLGVINLHSGQLPQYRGVMASFWAMLNGESFLGTTLHTIDDASIDTGRVIASTELPIDSERSYLWHVLALYTDGCEEILRAVNCLSRGETLPAVSQGEGSAYYSFPEETDLQRFAARGLQLFDSDTLRQVCQQFLPASDIDG
jgi:methionyl-tRNA formyltransferase